MDCILLSVSSYGDPWLVNRKRHKSVRAGAVKPPDAETRTNPLPTRDRSRSRQWRRTGNDAVTQLRYLQGKSLHTAQSPLSVADLVKHNICREGQYFRFEGEPIPIRNVLWKYSRRGWDYNVKDDLRLGHLSPSRQSI
ncbi:hypothetical protein NDU88_004616 [Pleurodeles waltl]|uniref:Uncharacterized protein n=1 Tax=Pleurodeles waltl TaxID=8319 RepID=A0AAV7LKB5_PLEWA|nr:hypothetical protein NDU88_004616 [Pleurodeles waltl]